VDGATETEAVEVNKVATEVQTVVDDAIDASEEQAGEEHAVEVNVEQVIDEFWSNAEYIEDVLSDENSVSFRVIAKDIDEIEVFKCKVRQSFVTTDVDILHQHFEISGLENFPDQLKFYLTVKSDKKAVEAILNLKAENILMMKVTKKKPK
jgi:hypothetical protein